MQAEAAHSTTDRAAIIAALREASRVTGSDFHYMLGAAMRESGLKTEAKSATSSACGLFQFVSQTWLGLIKEHGAKYGLGSLAGAISRDASGRYRVADGADRQAILALRNDPKIAALMEGEYARSSRTALESELGRSVCAGELYAAHFLGPGAACKLIALSEQTPDASAAEAFPQAAAANRSVFYNADGSAKSVREVYDWALRQPGGDGLHTRAGLRSTIQTDDAISASEARMASTSAAFAAFMNWAPSRPSFSALQDLPRDEDGQPQVTPPTPFLLTPGVMELLSSLVPSHG
jgi:hypothetical protein